MLPRLNPKRDNGILYHATGPHGKFWNVWMRSHEMQIQETDMGDYFALAGTVMNIKSKKVEITNLFMHLMENSEPLYQEQGFGKQVQARCR